MSLRRSGAGLAISVGLAAIAVIAETSINRSAPICTGQLETLDVFQSTSIGLLQELIKLLLAVGYLMFGAIGGVFYRLLDRRGPANSTAIGLLTGAGVLAALSLYYGYVGQIRLVEMLVQHCFDVSSPAIAWPHFIQYYSLLAVVLILLAVIAISERLNGQGRPG